MHDEYDRGSFRLDPNATSFQMTGFRWRDAPVLLVSLVLSVCLLTGFNFVVHFGLSFLNHDTVLVIFGVSLGYLAGVRVGAARSNTPAQPRGPDTLPESLELSERVKAIADEPERFIEAIKVYREESGYEILPNGKKRYIRATVVDVIISLLFPFWGLLIGGIAAARGERKRGLTMMAIGGIVIAMFFLLGYLMGPPNKQTF